MGMGIYLSNLDLIMTEPYLTVKRQIGSTTAVRGTLAQ